eukprot:TRINITY_DN50460_c0_g1_i1.p1 TRINITY_DN50460_c0_g1~~TRINITY_DN50460_c0_g1_i1.p1  ORF type:complete len:636 (-),score=84.86 TRINITY_DN50460_c0_g1_i1:59-1735(-)
MTDRNSDGFVEGAEAHSVCLRSNLPEEVLRVAWECADADRDGRLTFHEFVVLMHIVSCRVEGLDLPQGGRGTALGVPTELREALTRLVESPKELHAGRSRSASSQGSACTSGANSPYTSRPSSPVRSTPKPHIPVAETVKGSRDTLQRSESEWRHGRDDGNTMSRQQLSQQQSMAKPVMCSFSIPSRKDLNIRVPEDDMTGSASASGGSSTGQSSPRFGSHRQRKEVTEALPQPSLPEVRRHLVAILDADRMLSRHLRLEADNLERKVQQIRETCNKVEPEARCGRDDGKRLADLERNLERQLADARRRLLQLREECCHMGDCRMHRHERTHYEETLEYLRQTLWEEERMLEDLRSSNIHLEKSCRDLQDDMGDFQKQRKEILEQSSAESDLLRAETQQTTDGAASARGVVDMDHVSVAGGEVATVTQAAPAWVAPASQTPQPPATPALSEHLPSWASSLVGGFPVGGVGASVNGCANSNSASTGVATAISPHSSPCIGGSLVVAADQAASGSRAASFPGSATPSAHGDVVEQPFPHLGASNRGQSALVNDSRMREGV